VEMEIKILEKLVMKDLIMVNLEYFAITNVK
jgi:hypothetical protein